MADTHTAEHGPLILYAVTVAPSAYVLLRGQLRMVRDQGYRVAVVCSPDPALEEFGRTEGVDVFGIEMTRGLFSRADATAVVKVVALLRRLRPVAVNVATPKAALVVGLAARLARVPVRIYSLWGLRVEGEVPGSPRHRLLRMAERVTASSSTYVLCASASMRLRAIELGVVAPSRAHVLGRGSTNGVDVDRFRPPSPEERTAARERAGVPRDQVVIGIVARLVTDKGVEVLMDALAKVRMERDVVLLVVGAYDDADPLPEPVRRRIESDPAVVITGYQTDTAPWYAAMDVMVLPSKREGLPNVLLEAAACGLPTVTSNATGCPDAIEDGVTGVVVPQDDSERLAGALLTLSADAELRARMGAAGRTMVVQHFAQPVVWSAISDLYRTVVGSRIQAAV